MQLKAANPKKKAFMGSQISLNGRHIPIYRAKECDLKVSLFFFCDPFPSYTTNVHLPIHRCKYCMWNSWWVVLYIIFVRLKFIVTISGKNYKRWTLLCGNDNWWSDNLFFFSLDGFLLMCSNIENGRKNTFKRCTINPQILPKANISCHSCNLPSWPKSVF